MVLFKFDLNLIHKSKYINYKNQILKGTFEAEKKNEEIAYGLVHPVQTFDPIYLQFFNYRYLIQRFLQSKSWNERFSVLFKGPGKRTVFHSIFIVYLK